METLFIVLAFLGAFGAGFFCCLFLGCCVVIADYKHGKKPKKEGVDNGENQRAQHRSRDVF